MKIRILVLGASGMLGGSLFRHLSKNKDFEVIGSVRHKSVMKKFKAQGFDNIKSGIDVTDDLLILNLFNETKPDWVLNCIGVIKQLPQAASHVPIITTNSLLPHKLASLCDKFGSRLVHFSTDCVFSGSVGNYTEKDIPDAYDLYGRSKLLGEIDYGRHITFRTSIIGHEFDSSVSLVSWFLNQSDKVRGYTNAIFSGLPTIYVAEFLEAYVLKSKIPCGLYNLSVDPIDKYSLLSEIRSHYNLNIEIEKHEEFKIDRSLDSSLLQNTVGYTPPTWPILIKKMHDEYKEYFS